MPTYLVKVKVGAGSGSELFLSWDGSDENNLGSSIPAIRLSLFYFHDYQ